MVYIQDAYKRSDSWNNTNNWGEWKQIDFTFYPKKELDFISRLYIYQDNAFEADVLMTVPRIEATGSSSFRHIESTGKAEYYHNYNAAGETLKELTINNLSDQPMFINDYEVAAGFKGPVSLTDNKNRLSFKSDSKLNIIVSDLSIIDPSIQESE